MPIDVALIEASSPDSHGFCSFGVGVDTTMTAARVAKHVVAQVNDNMPRTYGDSFIHVDDIDAIVNNNVWSSARERHCRGGSVHGICLAI